MSEAEFNWEEFANEFESLDAREFAELDARSGSGVTREQMIAALDAKWQEAHDDPDHDCSDPESCYAHSKLDFERKADRALEAIAEYKLQVSVDDPTPDPEHQNGVHNDAVFTIKLTAKAVRPIVNFANDGLMMAQMKKSIMESMLGGEEAAYEGMSEEDLENKELVDQAIKLLPEVLELIALTGLRKLEGV